MMKILLSFLYKRTTYKKVINKINYSLKNFISFGVVREPAQIY